MVNLQISLWRDVTIKVHFLNVKNNFFYMVNKQLEIPNVPGRELDLLEELLEKNLQRMHYFKDKGLRSDAGGPEYSYAYVHLKYGLSILFFRQLPQ